jgi:exodeoxyribonuclease VII large subunit
VSGGLLTEFFQNLCGFELRSITLNVGKNGHLYLHLTERNEAGHVLDKTSAIIWCNQAIDINSRLKETTGEGLRNDIKILCRAKARFDALFGFSLIIEDVDPAYTLGDLIPKLAHIRKRLVQEQLFDLNRELLSPTEFVRIAVISPETSAGLGDFRQETDRLQAAGLCHFQYFLATFQGIDAPASISAALQQALVSHQQRRFDALVIIRGGGSVTDLAWLNDLELARLTCQLPIPVFTGIGHERDSTILDEIAHRSFDTPSKVALHIAHTIRDNANGAIAALNQINTQVGRIIARENTSLTAQLDRVLTGTRSSLERATADEQRFMASIRTAATHQFREASLAVTVAHQLLTDEIENTTSDATLGLRESIQTISHCARLQLNNQDASIEKLSQGVELQAQASTNVAGQELRHLRTQMG